jgi:penicillin-binding protein 1A
MSEEKERKEKTPAPKLNYKRILRWLWIIGLTPFVFILLLVWFASRGWLGELPTTTQLENPESNLATQIVSADGKVLGKYYKENRVNVKFKDLSPFLVNALIATEDARFRDHSGVDLRGLFRVLMVTVIGGDESGGGGSTITQQLAKMLFSERPKSKLKRGVQKIKEWVIATRLETQYTKEEILTMYLNKFDFLNQAVGISSAAHIYFNTTPDSLTLEQAAMLIGMAKNPSLFNPLRREKETIGRRNVVMSQMVKYGYLSQHAYDSLKTLPLGLSFHPEDHNEGLAPYFREYLRTEFLDKWCAENKKPDGSEYNIYSDGLKIYTTIDSRLQQYAEQAVREQMSQLQERFEKVEGKSKKFPFVGFFQGNKEEEIKRIMEHAMKNSERYKNLKAQGMSESDIEKNFETKDTMRIFSWKGEFDTIMTPVDSIRYYKKFLQAGFMSMDPQTGYIKAWVGGINHSNFQYDHVQREHSRQVGSTFKPFVYLCAIQAGWSPCTQVPNVPVTIKLPDGKDWVPRNSSPPSLDNKMLTLKKALANSVNYISAYIMKQFGPQSVVRVAQQMGITAKLDPVPSLCLGSADVSVFEMVGAYSAFANKGTWIEPTFVTRIEDKNGKVLWEYVPKKVEAMDEVTAYVMLQMMKGVTQSGTGIGLRSAPYNFTEPIAGKTGTTQHNADGWFMGITPDLVSGGWVGGEDLIVHFNSLAEGQGAKMALPIWGNYMKRVYADKKLKISKGDFEKPSKHIDVDLDCSKYDDHDADIDFDATPPDEDPFK